MWNFCTIGVGCASDNLGTNFLIAFLENFQSGSYDLEIYPTTFSGTPNISVVVSDQLGNSTDGLSEAFLLNAGQMYTVDVPGNLELIGIEQAHKAVQVGNFVFRYYVTLSYSQMTTMSWYWIPLLHLKCKWFDLFFDICLQSLYLIFISVLYIIFVELNI